MKKTLFLFLLILLHKSLISQPSEFTWTHRHGNYTYISGAKDQKEQGSCNIFASVAAVEAISQIYFNKNGASLDLSESYIHSSCGPIGGCSIAAVSLEESLIFFKSNGVIDDYTLPFPASPTYPPCCYYRQICNVQNPSYSIKIPDYHIIVINSDVDLKKVIIDHGPVIAHLSNNFGCLYDNSSCNPPCNFSCNGSHTVLIVGWKPGTTYTKWQVKDSWACNPSLGYHEFNIFSYSPDFYYIIPDTLGTKLTCTGNGCTNFTNRSYNDNDADGFYNWGIGPKPSDLTNAPNQMDYDDSNPSIISLDNNYNPQSAPYISIANDRVCSYNDTIKLRNLPYGFTCTWSVSPSYYFTGQTSGSGTTANVTPLSTEIMKSCTVTFTIHETGTSWTKQYYKNFIINGPNPSDISISAEDSYGHTPTRMSGRWLLCPHTTYYIYLNNSGNCTTYDYSWTTPAAWTQFYNSSNYVSVNTNNQSWGTVDVYAKTCCSATNRVKIKTEYFSGDNCGGYFIAYPNPASELFTLLFKDDFDLDANEKSLEIFDSNNIPIFKLKNFLKENTIETFNWKEGFYYIILRYNGKSFPYKIRIEH